MSFCFNGFMDIALAGAWGTGAADCAIGAIFFGFTAGGFLLVTVDGVTAFGGGVADWGDDASSRGKISEMLIRSTEVNSGSFELFWIYLGKTMAEESRRT